MGSDGDRARRVVAYTYPDAIVCADCQSTSRRRPEFTLDARGMTPGAVCSTCGYFWQPLPSGADGEWRKKAPMRVIGYRESDNWYCPDCRPAHTVGRLRQMGNMGPPPTCHTCGKRWVPTDVLEAGGLWVTPDPPREAHTPGPWSVLPLGPSGTYTATAGEGGSCVTIAGMIPAEANARLIAAAPELLDLARRYAHRLTADERRWIDAL